MTDITAASTGYELKDWAALISASVAVIAVVTGYFTTRRTLAVAKENAEAASWQKANEAELKAIQERLDTFYGPFRTISEVNKLMNLDLRNRQAEPTKFVLITKLFDQAWRDSRPAGEKAMLKEIEANSKKLRTFIEERVGMVDEKVMPYLARATAHYRMIELAYAGELGDDPEPFEARYVFPRRIEDVLRLEVERLERRREVLRTSPFAAHPSMPPLKIPEEWALPAWPYPGREATPGLTIPIA